MPNERSTPSVSDPHEGDRESAPTEHPARTVDPFRKQLDSQPREVGKPGQSGFFRPQVEDGRYSLRNVPVESVQVRSSSTPSPVPPTISVPRPAPSPRPSGFSGASIPKGGLALEIPPTVHGAAERWRITGVSPVPSHASSRHARAMQRAMLLALMQRSVASSSGEPSIELPMPPLRESWPAGLSQRAAWLFRAGWHADPVEFDSCLALLDTPNAPEVKDAILALISLHQFQAGSDPKP